MLPDNPLYRFEYCPICGAHAFRPLADNARKCDACGLTYYTNPRGATVALLLNARGELLVGTRACQPAQGTLDLVGGFMDLDETAEEALCREVHEESGLTIKPDELRYLFSQPNTYPFSGICVKTIDLFFEIRLTDCPTLQGSDDISGLHWLPLDQVKPERFGLESIRRGVERYLAGEDSRK